MIIPNSGMSSVVESSGVQSTSAFNIARTPHMFNILSSGLYSDKCAAVLREIGCNANDAHIMGGCPERPIQVKLPSALDRSFYVKDWGPGLDDHEMQGLYCTYGASTKQDDPDTTGAFGLGCKSPFAYTMQNDDDADGFTVESTKDGVKRIYTCYIGDSGAPAISRLYEGPAEADWPHGLKVTFPVKMSDIPEFHDKAREVYSWFKVTPEILGLNMPVSPTAFHMVGEFFSLSPVDGARFATPGIIMGGVRYPLNATRLRNLSEVEQALLGAAIHLWVPLGTVMMTPSREELEYTDRTRRGVSEWLKKAALAMAERVRDVVTTPEATMWEWYKKIQTYTDTLPFSIAVKLASFLELAGVPKEEIERITLVVRDKAAVLPAWAGDGMQGPAVEYLRNPETGQFLRTLEGELVSDPAQDRRGCRVWTYSLNSNGTVKRREVLHGRVRVSAEKSDLLALKFVDNVQCFYADSKSSDTRVRHLVRSGGAQQVLLVLPVSPATDGAFLQRYAKRLTSSGAMEGLPLLPVSSLVLPSVSEEAKEKRKLVRQMAPRQQFADNEVGFLDMTGEHTTVKLGDVPETALYYMCASGLESARRHQKFWNRSAEAYLGFNGDCKKGVMRSMAEVFKVLGLEVEGVVLVPQGAAAKRLKLAEQGFVEFLPWVKETIHEEDNWTSLLERVCRGPLVDLKELYRADDYGILGILGHHAVRDSEFWQRFTAGGCDPALADEVREFVKKVQDKADAHKNGDVQASLLGLCSSVAGLDLKSQEFGVQGPYDVRQEFLAAHKMYRALQEDVLVRWAHEDIPRALVFLKGLQVLSEAYAPQEPQTALDMQENEA